ncbi:MFS transporter [Chitinivorax sp. B]|uniref:MFS transporter n=1 Tax=Chitinivorax sp. B TaxID=2502235 RepID=UPI0020180F79|nr:MFS transporter [Chitinivorax sp. B]
MLKQMNDQKMGRNEQNSGKSPPMLWALASLSLSMLLPSLTTSIANIGLPTLADVFAVSFQTVQWVVLAYLIAITTLIVSVGRLGDMIGRRRLLLIGIGLFSAASLICGMVSVLSIQLIARVFQGLGAAIMMALSMAMVGGTIPKEKTGHALGLLGTMSSIGTALGPSLGGMLIATLGWRTIFLINVPLGLVTLLLAYLHLPADQPMRRSELSQFDLAGTVCLALALSAYALSMTLGHGHFGWLNTLLLLGAMVGVGLFIWVESKVKAPLVNLALFRDKLLCSRLVNSTLVSTVLMAMLIVGPFYLARVFNLSASLVGLIVSIGPMVAALTAAPSGRLVDRLGAQRMAILGLVGIAVGASLLVLLPTTWGIPGYVVPMAAITGSYALFQTANNTSVLVGVSPDQRGLISGMLNLSRNLGLITGTAVMGAVFSMASGVKDITAAQASAVTSGMQATFSVTVLLIVIAIVIAMASRFMTLQPGLARDAS